MMIIYDPVSPCDDATTKNITIIKQNTINKINTQPNKKCNNINTVIKKCSNNKHSNKKNEQQKT